MLPPVLSPKHTVRCYRCMLACAGFYLLYLLTEPSSAKNRQIHGRSLLHDLAEHHTDTAPAWKGTLLSARATPHAAFSSLHEDESRLEEASQQQQLTGGSSSPSQTRTDSPTDSMPGSQTRHLQQQQQSKTGTETVLHHSDGQDKGSDRRASDATKTTAQKAVRAAFYIWLSVLNLVASSLLWACMADAFSSGAALRLFGCVAL